MPPPLSRTLALDLYRTLLTIRRVEQKVAEIYPSDKIQSPVHLSIGQEAVAAGVCRALRPADRIYGTYRGHGIYIAKGGGLNKFFAELYAKDSGCARGKGGSMHLTAPEQGLMGCSAIVASTIPIAVGDALASQRQGRRRVVVSFFGDGAVDEGVFFESVNFAVLKNLPVLFVLENNGYAIHSPVSSRHGRTDLYRMAEGLGLRGHRFDGNDVFKVYAAADRHVHEIRKNGPPRLLEFTTFRWQEHVGPSSDLDAAYRASGERTRALRNDPLVKAEDVLRRRFRVAGKTFAALEKAVRDGIVHAVRFAEKSPFPGPERLWEGMFL